MQLDTKMDYSKLEMEQLVMFQAGADMCWYRGIVTQVTSRNVHIFSPDYGFTEKIPIKEGRVQPLFCEELGKVKYFASPCELLSKCKELADMSKVRVFVDNIESIKSYVHII